MTVFYTAINNASARLTSPHTLGDGVLVVDDATPFGSPNPSAPIHVTASDGTHDIIFAITSISGNTLTIGSLLENTTDFSLLTNSVIENRFTAGDLTAVQSAVNLREVAANKGVVNGYAGLDSSGKVPTDQLPDLGMVDSVFGRTGVIVASAGDYGVAQITGAAPLASPTFTGTPSAPTPSLSDNSTKLATTAYVLGQGFLTAAPVTSVAGRTGIVTLSNADISGLGSLATQSSVTTGQLPTVPINKGGTNSTSQTANGIVFFNGTSLTTNSSITYDGTQFTLNGRVDFIPAVGDVGLTIKAVTSQNANAFQITNNSDVPIAYVTPAGVFTGNGSGLTNLTAANISAGTASISISGNAATVSNGIYTTGSYSDPTWLSSLAGAKISGDISGNAASITGSITESQVTSLTNDLAATEKLANKDTANGYAGLDGSGKLASSQLPSSIVGALVYQGTWDANLNTPTLTSGHGTKGFYYKVSLPGFTNLDGNSVWHVGDLAIFDGSTWDKVDNYEAVTSVAGRIGAVTLDESDITNLTSDLALKAPLASPTFTGTPAGPTPLTSDNSTKLSTTAYVQAQGFAVDSSVLHLNGLETIGGTKTLADGVNLPVGSTTGTQIATSSTQKLGFYGSTAIVRPTGPILTALSNLGLVSAPTISESDITNLTSDLAAKAPLSSPTFTGTPSGPTPATADSSTKLATTAYVQAQSYLTTNAVTTVFTRTGAVTAQTGDYSVSQITGAAPSASPTFTGTITVTDAVNIVLGTATGTKFGTGTGQKIGFFNATPVVQQTGNISTALTNLGLITSPTIAESDVTSLVTDLSLKAPLASPALTGNPTAPTQSLSDNSTKIATTAFVQNLQTSFTIGDGSSKSFLLNHNLNSQNPLVSIRAAASPYGVLMTYWEATDVNNITVYINPAPTSGQYVAKVRL